MNLLCAVYAVRFAAPCALSLMYSSLFRCPPLPWEMPSNPSRIVDTTSQRGPGEDRLRREGETMSLNGAQRNATRAEFRRNFQLLDLAPGDAARALGVDDARIEGIMSLELGACAASRRRVGVAGFPDRPGGGVGCAVGAVYGAARRPRRLPFPRCGTSPRPVAGIGARPAAVAPLKAVSSGSHGRVC